MRHNNEQVLTNTAVEGSYDPTKFRFAEIVQNYEANVLPRLEAERGLGASALSAAALEPTGNEQAV